MVHMTVAQIASGGYVPEFTRGDRLRKAREDMALSREDFAQLVGVSRQTITNAETESHGVRRITLNAWSSVTGADPHWLEVGHPSPEAGKECELCARQDSNLRPRD